MPKMEPCALLYVVPETVWLLCGYHTVTIWSPYGYHMVTVRVMVLMMSRPAYNTYQWINCDTIRWIGIKKRTL